MNGKLITQLSIFVNNSPGSLASVAKTFELCGINMKICNLAESVEFGILRTIVENPDGAAAKLREKGVIVRETEVIGIKIHDVPGGLHKAAKILGDADINIEYGYAFTGKNTEGLFIRVDDPESAIGALEKAGITLIKSSEI